MICNGCLGKDFSITSTYYNRFTGKENEEVIYNRYITALVLFKRHGTEKGLYI